MLRSRGCDCVGARRMAGRYGVGATGEDWVDGKPAPPERPVSAEPQWTTSSAVAQWPPRSGVSREGGANDTQSTRRRQAWRSAHGTVWERCIQPCGVSARERSESYGCIQETRTRVATPAAPWRRVAASDMPYEQVHSLSEIRRSGKGAARLVGTHDYKPNGFHTTSWYRDQSKATTTNMLVIRRPPGDVVCADHPHSHIALKGKQ